MRHLSKSTDPATKAGYKFGYTVAGPILAVAALAVVIWAALAFVAALAGGVR